MKRLREEVAITVPAQGGRQEAGARGRRSPARLLGIPATLTVWAVGLGHCLPVDDVTH